MLEMLPALPFMASAEDEVELTVVDLGVARALWEGVPIGRLLARIRLHRDERDLIDLDQRASGLDFADASWDIAIARILGSAPAALDRIKRAIARHALAAFDEGGLAATDEAIAALVYAHLSSPDADASPAEGAAESLAIDEAVRVACVRLDERLGRPEGDRRAAPFEACLELARRGASPAWPLSALRQALGVIAAVAETDLHDSGGYPSLKDVPDVVLAASVPLYPWSESEDVPVYDRRSCLLDRPRLERAVLRPERDLAAIVARASSRHPGLPFGKIVADVRAILNKHGALILNVVREPKSHRDPPRIPPASWQPIDADAVETAVTLAAALERGAITVPRARSLLIRGGDIALDAIGKEMLNVAAHPFASAAFAEILAPFARERDVVRLVTYFAIAPDPKTAAHALGMCNAREVVVTVLRNWLETMLPADGARAEPGSDAGVRIASCVAALEPYPWLSEAMRSVVSRTEPRSSRS
jgi:hypothetical protein